jgi:hypothetical protein
VTHQDVHAELVLELANLLADARLGGVQALCCFGEVEPALGDFPQVP